MDNEEPAIVQGTYADYKRVPSRKVFQIIVEVPIEQAPLVHTAFGEPNPDGAIWVAVALLNPEHTKLKQAFKDSVEAEKKGGRLAKQAGMLCDTPSFWRFLEASYGALQIYDKEMAAEAVYQLCSIKSRRELDHNLTAGSEWEKIEGNYHLWLQGYEVGEQDYRELVNEP